MAFLGERRNEKTLPPERLRKGDTVRIALLAAMFVMISLWEYCSYFYNQKRLPYAYGFLFYTSLQWIIVAVNLIRFFGWLYGVIGLLAAMFILQYVTHFTLGLLYNLVFGENPLWPIALFGSCVWICGILTVISFFVF